MSIDHTAFPHIFDAILAASSPSVLAAFRATSHAIKLRVEPVLFHHVCLAPHPPNTTFGRPLEGIGLWTPDGTPLLIIKRLVNMDPAQRAARALLSLIRRIDLTGLTGMRTYFLTSLFWEICIAAPAIKRVDLSSRPSWWEDFDIRQAGRVDVVEVYTPHLGSRPHPLLLANGRRYTILYDGLCLTTQPSLMGVAASEVVLVWMASVEPKLATAICAHDRQCSLLPSDGRRPKFWTVCKVGITEGKDADRLEHTAREAYYDYLRQCDLTMQNNMPLPLPPFVSGVKFMSLEAYKAMRGAEYELEGMI